MNVANMQLPHQLKGAGRRHLVSSHGSARAKQQRCHLLVQALNCQVQRGIAVLQQQQGQKWVVRGVPCSGGDTGDMRSPLWGNM
jgi:hypothetical protein